MTNVPTMLTIKETALRSGLAQHYLRRLCIENKIVFVKCGAKYLINYEMLIEFLNRGNQVPAPPIQEMLGDSI